MKRTVAAVALGAFAVLAAPAGAEPVNLAGPGLVPVTVTDPSASIAGVAPTRSGLAEGRVVAHYDKQALIRAGALSASTTRLVASDGSSVPVEPEVVLEVKVTGTRPGAARLTGSPRAGAASTAKAPSATAATVRFTRSPPL